MKGTEFPERPWSRVGADFFFHKGSTYLLMIDYYSRDVEICQVTKKVDTGETISKMQKAFSRQGIPDILFSDNGPQFSSCEFKQFAKGYGFEHITSSPRYPQSNGEVERAVQTLKAILNKTNDEYLGLLSYRNTPLKNGYSPAQLNMGRRLKSRVPCHPDELKPRTPDADLVRKKEKEYRKQMQVNYDRRHKATKEADELSPGDRAWLPDLRVEGKVLGRAPGPRSYIISTPTGLVRRNRKMTRNLGPGHNIPLNPVSDSETNPPMPRGDLPEREDTDVQPVVPSVESPGRGTVPSVPSPESSATSVRRSKRAKAVPKRLIKEF